MKLKLDDEGQTTYVAMQLNILKNKKDASNPSPPTSHQKTKAQKYRKHVLPILHIYNIA